MSRPSAILECDSECSLARFGSRLELFHAHMRRKFRYDDRRAVESEAVATPCHAQKQSSVHCDASAAKFARLRVNGRSSGKVAPDKKADAAETGVHLHSQLEESSFD